MIKIIFVNLLSTEDILKAEREKSKLENKGFKLIQQSNTFTQAKFIYEN